MKVFFLNLAATLTSFTGSTVLNFLRWKDKETNYCYLQTVFDIWLSLHPFLLLFGCNLLQHHGQAC